MDKEVAVRKSQEVRERVRRFAAELRREAYGEQGFPDWGVLFSHIEELGVQIGGCPLPKPPDVAVVQMDGGRLQIFNRSSKESSLPAISAQPAGLSPLAQGADPAVSAGVPNV